MATYESDPDGPCKQAADRIEALYTHLDKIERNSLKAENKGLRDCIKKLEERITELEGALREISALPDLYACKIASKVLEHKNEK